MGEADVLDFLRGQFARSDRILSEMRTDIVEIESRLGHLEMHTAEMSVRIDRVAGDVALIKRRLELVDAR